MDDWMRLLPPIALLATFACVCIALLYLAFRSMMFCSSMKALATELSLHYTQTMLFDPPAVGGMYQGRMVGVDVVEVPCKKGSEKNTRVRVFHNGTVDNDFTIGKNEFFKKSCKDSTVRRLDTGNQKFDSEHMVMGGEIAKVKEFLNAETQGRIIECDFPFTVGKHHVSFSTVGCARDRKMLADALKFLLEMSTRVEELG
ncbi:MAG: hypothetical protein V1744_02470 [Candidatus Altiarchaeota archaeon]